MQYAILCYDSETLVGSWSQQKDDALMVRLGQVQDGIEARGKLGPVARLLPTTSAVTVRPGSTEPVVIDGPFAETKEQLLGFYVVDADSLEEVIDYARNLLHESGALEIRPIRMLRLGGLR